MRFLLYHIIYNLLNLKLNNEEVLKLYTPPTLHIPYNLLYTISHPVPI